MDIDMKEKEMTTNNEYEIIETFPVSTKIVPNGGIGIRWIGPIGFGECVIYWEEDNKLHADTEYLSNNEDKKFLKKMLDLLVHEIIIDN